MDARRGGGDSLDQPGRRPIDRRPQKEFRVALSVLPRRPWERWRARPGWRPDGPSSGSSTTARPTGPSSSSGDARRVSSALRSEVARRRLAKTPEHTPAMSEQKELLRHAEASLREAEAKILLVKKWEPVLQQAVLEYPGQHPPDLRPRRRPASPTPMHLLGQLVDILEAYRPNRAPVGRTARARIGIRTDRGGDPRSGRGRTAFGRVGARGRGGNDPGARRPRTDRLIQTDIVGGPRPMPNANVMAGSNRLRHAHPGGRRAAGWPPRSTWNDVGPAAVRGAVPQAARPGDRRGGDRARRSSPRSSTGSAATYPIGVASK